MSSERLNVLVIGYGSVGSYVIPELLSPLYLPRVHTLLLVRPASLQDDSKSAKLEGWAEQGASIVQGDITDGEEALARLMRAHRVHTVLCLVGYPQLGQQMPVLAAAQAAGVQHFFPSEFGMDVEALPEGGTMEAMRATRLAVRQAVRASGLPWTVVNAGYFAEYVFNSPFFGVDIRSRTVTAPVSFDVCISLASLVDVARDGPHAAGPGRQEPDGLPGRGALLQPAGRPGGERDRQSGGAEGRVTAGGRGGHAARPD